MGARKYPDEPRDRAIRLVLWTWSTIRMPALRRPAGRWAPSWGSRRTRCAAGPSRRRSTAGCGRGPRRRMRCGSGRWRRRMRSFAGSTRSCARRALFSRPSSTTGSPGGGLHRGLPGPVRGRADLPGLAPGPGAHLAVGELRGAGAAAVGPGGPRRRAGETRSCGFTRTAASGTAPGRSGTSSTARASPPGASASPKPPGISSPTMPPPAGCPSRSPPHPWASPGRPCCSVSSAANSAPCISAPDAGKACVSSYPPPKTGCSSHSQAVKEQCDA
jgi:hypothetical protein